MKSMCVVLLSLFAVAMSQDGCCMPEKLTANEGLVRSQLVDGVPRMIFGNIVLSMDETIRKINSDIHLYVEKEEIRERVLQDYTTCWKKYLDKTQYIIQDGKCMKSLLGDWKAHCLTKNDSTFMSNLYFGLGTNTLDGSSYAVKGTGDVTAYLTVTREDPCVPIGEWSFGSKDGVPFFMTVGFSNMTSSIPDPSVFNIPAICQTAPTIPLVTTSVGGSYLFR